MHTHISVHPTTGAPSDASQLTSHETSFLSGLLTHLPAIQAFTTPISASYARVVDGIWSGGTYVCWGTYNKDVPVRLCNAASPTARNFEVKCVDGLANPLRSVIIFIWPCSVIDIFYFIVGELVILLWPPCWLQAHMASNRPCHLQSRI